MGGGLYRTWTFIGKNKASDFITPYIIYQLNTGIFEQQPVSETYLRP